MMAKHDHRGTNGRFAPRPPEGDPSAYEHVTAPSANPQGEHDERVGTIYAEPVHDFANGPVHRLIPHRRVVEIDGMTGEALREVPEHELHARAVYARAVPMLAAAAGDPFTTNLVTPMTGPETRSYRSQPVSAHQVQYGDEHGSFFDELQPRHVPGQDGYRLPALGQTDDLPVKNNTGIPNDGLFR
jgi:hypothetical protein